MFVSNCAAAEHLLAHVLGVVLVLVGLLRNTSLLLPEHVFELFGCSLLLLCFQDVCRQMICNFLLQFLPVGTWTLKNCRYCFGWMVSNTENVFRKMCYPEVGDLIELGLALIWETSYKATSCNAGSVPHQPAFITQAKYERRKKVWDEWLKSIFLIRADYRKFSAYLRDAVTGSFAIWLIFRHALRAVVLADLFGVLRKVLLAVLCKK